MLIQNQNKKIIYSTFRVLNINTNILHNLSMPIIYRQSHKIIQNNIQLKNNFVYFFKSLGFLCAHNQYFKNISIQSYFVRVLGVVFYQFYNDFFN